MYAVATPPDHVSRRRGSELNPYLVCKTADRKRKGCGLRRTACGGEMKVGTIGLRWTDDEILLSLYTPRLRLAMKSLAPRLFENGLKCCVSTDDLVQTPMALLLMQLYACPVSGARVGPDRRDHGPPSNQRVRDYRYDCSGTQSCGELQRTGVHSACSCRQD